MKNQESRPVSNGASDAELEHFRMALHDRLRRDRVRLTTLSATLARAEQDAASCFEEIRAFAHRLGGTAAVFDADEITAAAHTLEQAANRALSTNAGHFDPPVWTALETLCEQLAVMAGRIAPLPEQRKARGHVRMRIHR
jgi:HPt (histidine-containing phosphotransfer) domain-containing protein